MTEGRFLTRGWNNWLTLGFGVPTIAYAMIFISTSLIADLAGFIGMFMLGAVY
jgi:hypothetical protein